MSYRQPTLSALASLYPDLTRENIKKHTCDYGLLTAESLAISYGVNPRTLARVLVKLGIRDEVHAILKGNREACFTS